LAEENCWVSLDCIADWEVHRVFLRQVETERLLWGTAWPLGALPLMPVGVDNEIHYLSDGSVPGTLAYPSDAPRQLTPPPFFVTCLEALRTAAGKVGLRRSGWHAIMYSNALRLLEQHHG
jgi:hypothetical protein